MDGDYPNSMWNTRIQFRIKTDWNDDLYDWWILWISIANYKLKIKKEEIPNRYLFFFFNLHQIIYFSYCVY